MFYIGLFGVGRMGVHHAGNIASHQNCKLVAIADPDHQASQAQAAIYGAEVRTADAIFSDDQIDAVLIASSTDTHAALVEDAARSGKHIFCEKPVDLSVSRVKECLAEVDAAGVRMMVGFNRRFDPDFATLSKRVAAGEIGKLELLTIISKDPAPPPVEYVRVSGGIFRDMTIHDFDMARFLLGEEPVAVSATASCQVDPGIGKLGDADTAVVSLRTAEGKLAVIINSRRAIYGYDQRIEVHGSLGMLSAGNQLTTKLLRADADGFTGTNIKDFFLERYADAFCAEWDCFVEVLEGKPTQSPDGVDGLAALVLAEAAAESRATGREVTVSLPTS